MADPSNVPAGCTFHPRCPYVQDICRVEEPQLVDLAGSNGSQPHFVRCHFAEELDLQGVRNSPQ